MRTWLIIAAAALALSGTVTTAEARFRGGRSVHATRPAPSVTPARSAALGVGIGAALPVRSVRGATAGDPEPGRPVTLRPILPVTAPAPAPVREVRTAAAWCSDKRVVGSGAGFCEIN
ncbi:hypothetical protein [Methylobacterium marchantiae]|uniref:Porin n=1 Tax=Methylobacterium marchantiae TaxID=600331 RepID=A0ABW3WSR9_9HYPH|nr:hypothetical protein AIGOOFII_0396 [Methylobacterium marchantiae]